MLIFFPQNIILFKKSYVLDQYNISKIHLKIITIKHLLKKKKTKKFFFFFFLLFLFAFHYHCYFISIHFIPPS